MLFLTYFFFFRDWLSVQQRRGLPHAHLAFQVSDEFAPTTAKVIDEHVRATWPDKDKEPELYSIVDKFMTHKDCRTKRRSCYEEGKLQCKKRFPKPPQAETTLDERGYPLYRRKPTDHDVIPYNPTLLLLLNAHINTEVSATVNIITYMFAWVTSVFSMHLYCYYFMLCFNQIFFSCCYILHTVFVSFLRRCCLGC